MGKGSNRRTILLSKIVRSERRIKQVSCKPKGKKGKSKMKRKEADYTQNRVVLVDIWWYWVSSGQYWSIPCGACSVAGGTGWYLVVLGPYGAELVDTWWYLVIKARYWLVLGGTGSVWCNTTWYLVVLGQYGAELVDTWLHLVSRRRNWLVLGGTGSVWGGTGWYMMYELQKQCCCLSF